MKPRKVTKYIWSLILIAILVMTGCRLKDDQIHIKFSTWGSETEISIIKPLIKEFEKENPGIKVSIMHIPQNYFQKLEMLVAANLTPDVIFINNLNLPIYASGNMLTDLNPYISNSTEVNKEEFFPESLKTMSYKEKLLVIPRDISNTVIYYNKDLFDRYKTAYPSENWSFEDLLQKARQLTIYNKETRRIDTFGISFDSNFLYVMPFIWSNGGKLFKNGNKQFALCDKAGCEGIQFYSDLRNKYHVAPKAYEAGNNTMAQMFMQQRVAMLISGRWNVPRFREDIKFRWDVSQFPAGKAGSIVGIDGSGWAISAKSNHPDEAWKLVEYLASKKSISRFSETGLIIPARNDVASSESFLNKKLPPENAAVFIKVVDNANSTPQIERWNEVVDEINTELEPVWEGNRKACITLKSIKKDVEELLE